MKKLRTFLDTNVVISYLLNEKHLASLFSPELLEKVEYIINPIVYQETIFVMRRQLARINLNKIHEFVKVVQIDSSKTNFYVEKLQKLDKFIAHTNDLLILQTAISECDYLLTLDHQLLEIRGVDSLKIVSPVEFFAAMRDNF